MNSMDSCVLLLFLFVCILNPCIKSWDLSEEEDLDLERHLNLLNKPTIKTKKNDFGEVYDCVDFYKQPAFDHPHIKNFTFEKSTLIRIQRRAKFSSNSNVGIDLPGGGCPLGTIPIRKITKQDLIRKKLVSKARPMGTSDVPGANYAIVRTIGPRYGGMQGTLSIYNPPCGAGIDNRYSASRLKFLNGPDSIEVGWRVDPALFNDNRTHFYIRTDVGQTHCYNLDCPGYISFNPTSPIGGSFPNVSTPGGKIYVVRIRILKDASGNWVLQVGPNYVTTGMWPAKMFTKVGGLGDIATTLEWGGEVFSPQGTSKPPMGSGEKPKQRASTVDAYVSQIQAAREHEGLAEIRGLESYLDNGKLYGMRDEGNSKTPLGHVMFFGGRGG